MGDGPRDLLVVGGGGHARVVIEAALSRPEEWRVLGFTDPETRDETTEMLGVRRLGSDEAISFWLGQPGPVWCVLGVGAVGGPGMRPQIAADAGPREKIRWATVVHRAAWLSPSARLGEGTVVMAGAVVNSGATLGAHVVVNTCAVIEHDVRVGDHSQMASGAVIGGGAVIGEATYVGLGARVRDHVTVGSRSLVAMGAVVVRDVGDGLTVAGVPARPFARPTGGA